MPLPDSIELQPRGRDGRRVGTRGRRGRRLLPRLNLVAEVSSVHLRGRGDARPKHDERAEGDEPGAVAQMSHHLARDAAPLAQRLLGDLRA